MGAGSSLSYVPTMSDPRSSDRQPVMPWWRHEAVVAALVVVAAGSVFVLACCVGVPAGLGLDLRDARHEAGGQARPHRRLPRLVAAAAAGSFAVLGVAAMALSTLAWVT